MGLVARQSIISTVLLYLGAAIGYLNILYLFPRFLHTSEIGIVRTVQDMAALFVPFAQFGLTQSLVKFFPRFATDNKTKPGFLTLILLVGIIGYIIFLGVFFIFKDPIASYFSTQATEIIEWFPLILAITLVLVIYNLLAAYAQSMLNIIAPNFIKDILFRLGTAIVLILYFYRILEFGELMQSLLFLYGLMLLAISFILFSHGQLKFSLDFSFMTRKHLKQLFGFAVFALLGSSGSLIIGKIDSIMVTGMLGTDMNGIYTTLFYIAVVMELPKRPINQITFPLLSRSFENNDLQYISSLYKKASLNQLLVGVILLIGIWINLDSIFRIMPNGADFAVGKWVVIIIGLGRILDMAAGINSEIIVMSKYYRFNMVLLSLLAVAMIIFNLLLIPRYGIEGAAMGSALALILFNLSKFIFIKMKMNIQPFQVASLSILILGVITLVSCLSVPALEDPYLDILLRSTLAVSIYGLGVWILKPSPELMGLINKYLRRNR